MAEILRMIVKAHKVLGFAADSFRLSCRGDLAQGNYLGGAAQWDQAEGLLREALAASGVSYVEAPGEAAFYGPKIDIQIRDIHGREFSLSTIQVDFAQPERFDLSYIAPDGSRARPVMVHRSIIGSLERLVGHLIEVHQGAFPAWYAPVQLAVLPIGAEQAEAAYRVADAALRLGLRAEVYPEESLGARIRKVSKVPFVAVIGAREVGSDEVALRERGGGQRQLPVVEALQQVGEHCRLPI